MSHAEILKEKNKFYDISNPLQFAVLTEGFVVASEHIFSFLLEKKRDD
jgi:hypothetical protein